MMHTSVIKLLGLLEYKKSTTADLPLYAFGAEKCFFSPSLIIKMLKIAVSFLNSRIVLQFRVFAFWQRSESDSVSSGSHKLF